jgi:hypothetical protein
VFLGKSSDPKYQELINKIAKGKEGIRMAHQFLTSISNDENERARLLSQRKWVQDREHEKAILRDAEAKITALEADKVAQNDKISTLEADNAALKAELQAALAKKN